MSIFDGHKVKTYDPPGSDPKNPGNSRFTIGENQITSGPAKDPSHPKGSRFISHGKIGGDHTTRVIGPDGNVIK